MIINLIKKIVVPIVVIIPFLQIYPQQNEIHNQALTGNLIFDSKLQDVSYTTQQVKLNFQTKEKKSRWLGGAMSLILPGAGEFYAQDYLKAAIFVVVEAAAITTAIAYTNKGDSQTQMFQNYANQNWDVAKYAAWTLQHIDQISPGFDASGYNVFKNDNWKNNLGNNSGWSKYDGDVNWSEMNRLELALGDGYSHQLVTSGQQQYYELIGKYPQFSHGWNTSNFNDTDFHILTDQFLWYAHQRGLANDYYTTGNTAIIFVYVNHFLSTLDAIWSIDKYNNSIAMNIRMKGINTANGIQVMPTLNLSYNF